MSVEIVSSDLDLDRIIQQVRTENTGGIVSFVGTVRKESRGHIIKELQYEVYEDMALEELKKVEDRAREQFDLENVIIVHRTGTFQVGERVVAIAVAARHRKSAFQSCEFIIDEIKKTVPIWKKEVAEDGEYWVGD